MPNGIRRGSWYTRAQGQQFVSAPAQRNFWEIPPTGGFFYLTPPWLCQEMIDEILSAMRKALATGVVEYRIGSRGLRRFTLKELSDLLGFWKNQLESSLFGASIIAKRGVPTDT